MKKILYFAAAVAAIVACSKEIDTTTPEIDNPKAFEKGQIVTLTVGTPGQTKATSTADATTGDISFKWEEGDQILVTVGGNSATFTVSKLINGGTSAEFTGEMPEGGDSFSAQFPVDDPVLATQTYSATEAIPHNMMKFTASGCTVGTAFTLTAAYAALRLNLYGIDRKVSQIVISNTSSEADPKPTYALTCETPVKVSNSKDAPTPFFIVVPAGTSAWKFQAALTLSEVSPSVDGALLRNYESEAIGKGIAISCSTLVATELQTFTAGSVLNMPAQSVTTVWAPVNCGYDATDYPYGKLYQWGRAVGCGYNDGSAYQETLIQKLEYSRTVNPDDGKFYLGDNNYLDWYSGSPKLSLWPMKSDDDGYINGKIDNPCPTGWRVPTLSELDKLAGGNGTGISFLEESGWDSTNEGYWFDGTDSPEPGTGIFLPAAGFRSCVHGNAVSRGVGGWYWSSSGYDNNAWILSFYRHYAYVVYENCNRAWGNSVRCVQD